MRTLQNWQRKVAKDYLAFLLRVSVSLRSVFAESGDAARNAVSDINVGGRRRAVRAIFCRVVGLQTDLPGADGNIFSSHRYR